jgi:phosphate starvation-inducible PhoH-like protein|tara:strand:- start:697 stop:1752 length:1056 start_codon:yes stop_codon:yes gene_type:complete
LFQEINAPLTLATQTHELHLEPVNNEMLANLCGQFDTHLRQIEKRLGVHISNRGNHFQVVGQRQPSLASIKVIKELYSLADKERIDPQRVQLYLQEAGMNEPERILEEPTIELSIKTPRKHIRPRGATQRAFIKSLRDNDLSFGVGPAGTGKTYVAVACAVEALERDLVRRIVLVRPAVEAGEHLGFLPGDLTQKVDPYLRPMYDALYEMLGYEKVARLIEHNIIEIAPLAFMRGRSLNESFIILDEAQNTTVEQMKMFLTRMGFGSRAVVTGDVTQVDLPRQQLSGLRHVLNILDGVEGIGISAFSSKDVVRHPMVQRIVDAYELSEADPDSPHPDRSISAGGSSSKSIR